MLDGGWALKLGQVGAHPDHLAGHPLHHHVDVGDGHGSGRLAREGDRAAHNDLKQLTQPGHCLAGRDRLRIDLAILDRLHQVLELLQGVGHLRACRIRQWPRAFDTDRIWRLDHVWWWCLAVSPPRTPRAQDLGGLLVEELDPLNKRGGRNPGQRIHTTLPTRRPVWLAYVWLPGPPVSGHTHLALRPVPRKGAALRADRTIGAAWTAASIEQAGESDNGPLSLTPTISLVPLVRCHGVHRCLLIQANVRWRRLSGGAGR